MNDALLDLDLATLLAGEGSRLRALSAQGVVQLGRELYAEEPLLHREAPERARRLAALIVAKAPDVNAALFVAPARACKAAEVASRFARLDMAVLAGLSIAQTSGELTPVSVDRKVWRRMAA